VTGRLEGFAHLYGDAAVSDGATIERGTFGRWLASRSGISLRWEHDPTLTLARRGADLELFDCAVGCGFSAELPTRWLPAIRQAVVAGELGCSFWLSRGEITLTDRPDFRATIGALWLDDQHDHDLPTARRELREAWRAARRMAARRVARAAAARPAARAQAPRPAPLITTADLARAQAMQAATLAHLRSRGVDPRALMRNRRR
jgi:hypothetical protein